MKIPFSDLEEKFEAIKRLVYKQLECYGTGLDGLTLTYSQDPETGHSCWRLYMDVNLRYPEKYEWESFRRKVHEIMQILEAIYPELNKHNCMLNINPVNISLEPK